MSVYNLSVMATFGAPNCATGRRRNRFAALSYQSVFPKNIKTVTVCFARRPQPMFFTADQDDNRVQF
tara:strand:- start:974 stop:1174 length:201 start_codon:yes stop_codon:yes gene_type:complete